MDLKEDIKARLSIEDIIGEYVQLKRAGRNFKGLSPWTNEKTPSFIVSPEKQIWHDFSSGRGGDVFSFVMEMEGLDFRAALEHLARRAGLDTADYDQGRSASNAKLKERLYEANEQATKFYQAHFKQNKTALSYVLKKRGYTKDTALKFRIGYSPSSGSALITYLKKQKFTDQEIDKAGLGRNNRDMFRGRVMIPLMDGQGRVIGFTARLLEDIKNAPKYINTPQTLIYDKGRHVFGLHLAKEAIRTKKYAVVVEGNLDVIASHQAGIANTVATAGTAITESHLKTISRFAPDVRLCFDQDAAGQAAAERAIPLASKAGVNLQMITMPSGKDPDELIQADPKAWQTVIKQPEYALDWLIGRYSDQLDLTTATGKRSFSDEVLKVIAALDDKVEQDHYIQKVAVVLDVNADALRAKMSTSGQTEVKKLKQPAQRLEPDDGHLAEAVKAQDHLLALLFHKPELVWRAEPVTPEMMTSDPAKALFKNLVQKTDKAPDTSDEYKKMLQLIYETLYKSTNALELAEEAERLKSKIVQQYVKRSKQIISDRLATADAQQTNELLEKDKALNHLLSEVSSGKKE